MSRDGEAEVVAVALDFGVGEVDWDFRMILKAGTASEPMICGEMKK